MASSPETPLARFVDAWNATDVDERWSLVHAATAEGVVVLDAAEPGPVVGRAALASALGDMRRRAGWMEAAGPAEVVWGVARLPVRLDDAAGALVGDLDAEGRLVRVVVFGGAR